MTEVDWDTSTDPQAMLEFLRTSSRASERKLRLFACACCRRIWRLLTDERSRKAVEFAERYADSEVGDEERLAAVEPESPLPSKGWAAIAVSSLGYSGQVESAGVVYDAPHQPVADFAANARAQEAVGDDISPSLWNAARTEECAAQADLLRDLFGPLPFRPVLVDPLLLGWNGGIVVKLAQAAYDERTLPEGTLDNGRLAVLADALEEAGATDSGILGHLRGPGPHVVGCHAVDLLLGKE
jgi:hypothetical protein